MVEGRHGEGRVSEAGSNKRFRITPDYDSEMTPFVEKKLKLIKQRARNYSNIVAMGRGEFNVKEGSSNSTIKLGKYYDDYQKWQINGLLYKDDA